MLPVLSDRQNVSGLSTEPLPFPKPTFERHSPACFSSDLYRRAIVLPEMLRALRASSKDLALAADMMASTLSIGGRVLTAGDGSSATEAQHLAAELTVRLPSRPFPTAALSLNSVAPGYHPQSNGGNGVCDLALKVGAFGHPGDTFVVFSTGGNSPELLDACAAAAGMELKTVAITGPRPNALMEAASVAIAVNSADTQLIREVHVVIVHLLCESVDQTMASTGQRETAR